jgi:hypothetical protein
MLSLKKITKKRKVQSSSYSSSRLTISYNTGYKNRIFLAQFKQPIFLQSIMKHTFRFRIVKSSCVIFKMRLNDV